MNNVWVKQSCYHLFDLMGTAATLKGCLERVWNFLYLCDCHTFALHVGLTPCLFLRFSRASKMRILASFDATTGEFVVVVFEGVDNHSLVFLIADDERHGEAIGILMAAFGDPMTLEIFLLVQYVTGVGLMWNSNLRWA